jgi:hypothetical protein
MMEAVATQFHPLTSAAQECDVIVAAAALQVAARVGGGEVGDSEKWRKVLARKYMCYGFVKI